MCDSNSIETVSPTRFDTNFIPQTVEMKMLDKSTGLGEYSSLDQRCNGVIGRLLARRWDTYATDKLLPSKTLENFTFFNIHEIIASS